MDNKESRFQYTYSAEDQSELEQIRLKYLPPEVAQPETGKENVYE